MFIVSIIMSFRISKTISLISLGLLLLIALVWACMTLFRYILPKAGKLMLPYLLWLFFAAYLNLGAALLN